MRCSEIASVCLRSLVNDANRESMAEALCLFLRTDERKMQFWMLLFAESVKEKRRYKMKNRYVYARL